MNVVLHAKDRGAGEGWASSEGVQVRTHPPAQAPASRPLDRPGKIQLTIIGGNAPVVVVKLQRTDTTLDLSQKAEKGMQSTS